MREAIIRGKVLEDTLAGNCHIEDDDEKIEMEEKLDDRNEAEGDNKKAVTLSLSGVSRIVC